MRRAPVFATALALSLGLGGIGAAHAADPGLDPGSPSALRAAAGAEFAAPGSAAITLGQTATNVDGSCSPNIVVKATGTAAGTQTYSVPGDGVLTSFSYNSGAVAGGVRLLLLATTGSASDFSVAFRGPIQPVLASQLNTYSVRVPVTKGWQLALTTTVDQMNCIYLGVAQDVVGYDTAFTDVDTTMNVVGTLASAKLNVSAVWEPDTDGDGYGDVSQDLCPQSASSQAACPAPNTTIKKAPNRKTTKRKVKLRFSSVAGATYTCQVDKAAPVACTSPFSKKLKVGRHAITVTATSPAGIADPTPPTVRFKIVKP